MQAFRRKKEGKKTVGFMIIYSFLYLPPKQMLKQMAENELEVYEEEVRDCRRAAGKVNQRKPKESGQEVNSLTEYRGNDVISSNTVHFKSVHVDV